MTNLLTVYFTSDIHGFLFPTDYATTEPKPMGLFGEIAQFRKDGNTLIIDGGDTFQGSPLTYYYHLKDSVGLVPRAMNLGGYDFVTLGNHDFNYGQKAMHDYLSALDAQCLCANVQAEGQPIAPCAVKTMENGLRVGVVGIVTDWVNRWENPNNMVGVTVSDPFDAARRALDSLRDRVDFTICIYHGGYEKDLKTGKLLSDSDENIGCRICEELDFDLLLTGHQHLMLENAVWHGTHLVQTPSNATHFIRVDVDENRVIRSQLVPAQIVDCSAFAAESAEVETWLDEPIGSLDRPLCPSDKVDMALHGSPIADLFNWVQLEVSGADLSCTNLANNVRGFDRSVTVRDVVATYVFNNTLIVIEIDEKGLREALENVATYLTEELTISSKFLEPKISHFNFCFLAGIEYTFDLSRPCGSRLLSLTRGGKPLEGTYTLVMNNYCASGPGGYDVFRRCRRVRVILTEMRELILDQFARKRYIEVKNIYGARWLRSNFSGDAIL